MSKRVLVTPTKVYESLQEMADEYEVTVSAVSHALNDRNEFRGVRVYLVSRVYAGKLKKGGWIVGAKDSRGRALIPMDQGPKVRLADVEQLWDVTIAWYFGKVNKW